MLDAIVTGEECSKIEFDFFCMLDEPCCDELPKEQFIKITLERYKAQIEKIKESYEISGIL